MLIGIIYKLGNWLPHDLPHERMKYSKMVVQMHERKSYLHRIVTRGEKWIHYNNPKDRNHR